MGSFSIWKIDLNDDEDFGSYPDGTRVPISYQISYTGCSVSPASCSPDTIGWPISTIIQDTKMYYTVFSL